MDVIRGKGDRALFCLQVIVSSKVWHLDSCSSVPWNVSISEKKQSGKFQCIIFLVPNFEVTANNVLGNIDAMIQFYKLDKLCSDWFVENANL